MPKSGSFQLTQAICIVIHHCNSLLYIKLAHTTHGVFTFIVLSYKLFKIVLNDFSDVLDMLCSTGDNTEVKVISISDYM